ncbi:hypothetical protein UG55_11462 [Frankia sp. EI5c]|uniref:hypothetical protein n=1 Tax=Frankia sp. EI5c TaxID=683316 RepID=UPI0007C31630|nr:hypothetical protein [Frankia sp. EI5c]OAA17957.1 hypothetical protein UG55_11462 [Frankia sp. EI5c]
MENSYEKYDWVVDCGADDNGYYLFVKSHSIESVLEAYRVAPEALTERVISEILPVDPDSAVCHVAVMPTMSTDWVAISEHGTRFPSYELLEPISRNAMAIQCGFPWGTPRIKVASNGRLIRDIDADHYSADDALPEEVDLPFKDAGPQASLMFIERITGIEMTPQWMLGPFRAAIARLEMPLQ